MDACSLQQAKDLHPSYKKWIDAEAKIKDDLKKSYDGFKFRAPSEPYPGYERKLNTYNPDNKGDFAAKLGKIQRG